MSMNQPTASTKIGPTKAGAGKAGAIQTITALFYGSLVLTGVVTAVGTVPLQSMGWGSTLVALLITGATALAAALGRARRVIAPMLICLTLYLILGLWQGMRPIYALVGGAAALAAWDLYHYRRRLDQVDRLEEPALLVRAHVIRLAGAVGLGVIAGMVGLNVRIQVGLGSILLVSLILVLGLSRVIRFLRRESD